MIAHKRRKVSLGSIHSAKGEFAITPSYDNAYDFSGGVAIVRQNGATRNRLAAINKEGTFLRQ